MTNKVIISGFGGQGVLAAGKLLAYAAMLQGKHVSWLPSYGPEKRGGASNCHIFISDEPVGSPFITDPNVVIAMSKPAFDKYEKLIEKGGVMICDSSILEDKNYKKDFKIISVPATKIAVESGNPKMANVILIGKLLTEMKLIDKKYVVDAMTEVLPEEKHFLIPQEVELLEIGMNYEPN
jgi:2-oxoglutarate ferredoxin oxidoreductase subunit gamma